MPDSNVQTVTRLVFILSITEALFSVIQHYFFINMSYIAVVSLHTSLVLIVTSIVIFNLRSKNEKASRGILEFTQNVQEHYKFAIDQHSIVATTDVKGAIIDVNDKFCEISGYKREELIGQDHRMINSGRQDKKYWQQMYRTIANGNIWKDEVLNKAKDGSYYWVDTTIIPLMDSAKKPRAYVSIRTDITRQKQIQKAFERTNKQLQKLSQLDDLTGIANRRAYEKHAEIEIQSAHRTDKSLSLLVIDIDDFKSVNDNLGHDTGDFVLRQVAQKISESLPRTTDFVARFGGEEFVVLMPSTKVEGAYRVAERIRNNINKINILISGSKQPEHITVSIGCANLVGLNLDKNLLFKQADTALYQAKNSGKNKSVIFREDTLNEE
jgi:diguanylate cyclase (GGDEF)-like protein/PAS domain S-box-containing protein